MKKLRYRLELSLKRPPIDGADWTFTSEGYQNFENEVCAILRHSIVMSIDSGIVPKDITISGDLFISGLPK